MLKLNLLNLADYFFISLNFFPDILRKKGKWENLPKIIFLIKNRYKEMTIKKYTGRKGLKKTFKRGNPIKKRLSSKKLVNLIKKISLKPSETKNTHNITENINLYHNSPNVQWAHLNTTQGTGDDNTGTNNNVARIGDEVIARGLSYKIWISNKLDRPNVMYRIIFFRYQSLLNGSMPSTVPYCSQGSTNYMIRDLDTEKFKIIKTITFQIQNNAQRISGTSLLGAEGHKYLNVWIPFKNQKIKYEDNSSVPRFFDYGFSICCYDSYGTLTTDNIASFAVNIKFYFKDP